MGIRGWCWVLLLAACRPAPPQHDASMFFGDVALGEAREVALTLTTHEAQRLTFQILEGDFSIDGSSRSLGAHEITTLLVRFTPTQLGPRSGLLELNGETISLTGRGTGARSSAPAQLYPGPFALIGGQPEKTEHAVLLMRNVGTAGSLLRLAPPRVEGTEVCIGDFTGDTCDPWEPPGELDTETLLEVPLAFRVITAGPRRWELVFPSNDVLKPELTVEVLAVVEALEPCVFAPTEVVFQAGPAALQLTHTGPGTCLVRELTLSPADALGFAPPPRLPARLTSGGSLTASIALRPLAPLDLRGVVHVVAAATPPFDVPVRRAVPPANCLVLSPASLDFGTLAQGCSSVTRNVQVYNACASPLTLGAISLCSGATPCPEFFVVAAPPVGAELLPGASPVTFSVKYVPAGSGEDHVALTVGTFEGMTNVLPLHGVGAPPPLNVDTFRQDTLPRVDVLVMVDSSPSFISKRAAVRTNLESLMNRNAQCIDTRWAFAAADGAPDATVELLPNDGGARWTSSLEPDFLNRALGAFDALPVGSEDEACIGPAAALVQDAGLRAGSSFGGLCITDALEQSPNPTSALQALRSQATSSWSTVTGVETSFCPVEAIDDGLHQSLVTTASGGRADICDPSWWSSLVPLGSTCSGRRMTFYLTGVPAGPLELAIDGESVPSARWFFDATNNAVRFFLGAEPAPGQTLTISYPTTCTP